MKPLLLAALVLAPCATFAADWQYAVPFATVKPPRPGDDPPRVLLWLPPDAREVRGLLVGGKLGIELDIALDPTVRIICAEQRLGIVYFTPHLSGTFSFWKEASTDRERWLKAFDDLAGRSGHPELRRVPWITMGHSTAGIFSRNVAHAFPGRVAGILHIKSGNFHQPDHLPPEGSLTGIPLLAMNGQLESFGPASGIRPELGRETQWQAVREDILKFRAADPDHLMSLWLDLGGDHFLGSRELCQFAALFIGKTAARRIPATLPPGTNPVSCVPLKASDGWLSDSSIYDPGIPAAPFAEFTGDKQKALWHFDGEIAQATVEHHRGADRHQALEGPVLTWIDDGDGWSFRASSVFLDTMPAKFGGSIGGTKVGHASTPILFRHRPADPIRQLTPDTFRVLRPAKGIQIAAVNEGDASHRATNRWSPLELPTVQGAPQTIEFPEIPDLKANAKPFPLAAKASSGLPVHYEITLGPVIVREETLAVSEVPANAVFPLECVVTAYQIGRRIAPAIPPATPVTRTFHIVKP